jgi:hypothetical protein
MLPGADVYSLLLDVPAYVSLGAVLSFFLLLLLYFSQRRDLERLRAWMEGDPGHPASDLAASEALLDRAEADLEELLGTTGPAGDAEPEPTLVATPSAARPPQPTTSDRPALEQITMEREALLPHPRWRHLIGRVSQPRVLGLVALGAVILGVAAIFGSQRILNSGGGTGDGPKPKKVDPAAVTVAVLNGTSQPGLAAKVGDDVKVNDFKLGIESNTHHPFDQTVVMYEPHQQRAANEVAHALGVKPVQPIDRQTQNATGSADVVVIAGADRAKP